MLCCCNVTAKNNKLNGKIITWKSANVAVVSQSLMSAGREFQTEGAGTEKARPAMSVRVRGTASNGAAADRRCLAGAAVCSMSLR